jgi:hypothetical protein
VTAAACLDHVPHVMLQVFVGSALEGDDAGVSAVKAWAVDKLPEGPTLYPKVWPHRAYAFFPQGPTHLLLMARLKSILEFTCCMALG